MHVSNKPKWNDHVKSACAKLQGDDPETTFKQAMSHAKATYKWSSPRDDKAETVLKQVDD
jgi:hypothetical protein